VLSSVSEGLPLSLIEYGHAGLATVATRVGECPGVLSDGALGVLVPPGDPAALAAAIVDLLRSPERRAALGGAFQAHVRCAFSAESGLARIASVYEEMLQDS
jgi:glycosyltransferase involved in cell wall biosynthesis